MSTGGGGGIGTGTVQIVADMRPLNAELDTLPANLQKKLDAATKTARLTLDPSGIQSGARRSGEALLQLGQFFDDAQYGFRAVANQVPQLAMALGAGAGLAGALAISATAVNQWVKNWDDVQPFLDDLGEGLRGFEWFREIADWVDEASESLLKLAANSETLQGSYFGRLIAGAATNALSDADNTKADAKREAAKERADKDRAAALKAIEGIADDPGRAEGALIDKAVKAIGGTAALDQIAQGDPRDRVAAMLRDAMGGDASGIASVRKRAEGTPLGAAIAEAEADRDREAKEKADREEEKARREEDRAWNLGIDRAIFDREKQIRGGEGQLDAAQEQLRMAESRRGVQFQGGQEYLKDIQAGAFDQSSPLKEAVRHLKEQLEVQKEQRDLLRERKTEHALAELG